MAGTPANDVGKVARERLHLFLAAETNDTRPYGDVAFVTVPGVLHKYAPVKNQNGG